MEWLVDGTATWEFFRPGRIGRSGKVEYRNAPGEFQKKMRRIGDQQAKLLPRVTKQFGGAPRLREQHRVSTTSEDAVDQPPNQRIFHNQNSPTVHHLHCWGFLPASQSPQTRSIRLLKWGCRKLRLAAALKFVKPVTAGTAAESSHRKPAEDPIQGAAQAGQPDIPPTATWAPRALAVTSTRVAWRGAGRSGRTTRLGVPRGGGYVHGLNSY